MLRLEHARGCILLFAFCLLFISNSVAQTNVAGGNVSGTWSVQNSPYKILGAITIPAGSTLTIQPGVKVLFAGHFTLNVQGNLIARGTASDSIIFDQFDAASSWHSIRIENVPAGSDSSIFEYCRIAHALYNGGDVTLNGGNAVLIKNFDKVRVTHCLIRHNKGGRGAGIYASHANIKINLNVIRNNTVGQYGGGIYIESGSPVINGNRVERNYGDTAGGIYLSSSASIVENNTISYNTSYWRGAGFIITASSTCVLQHNLISYNESGHDDAGGLYINGSSPKIINNTIAFNKAEDGEGVLVGGNSNPEFTNTLIYFNRDRYQDANLNDEVYIEAPAKSIFNNNNIQAGVNNIGGGYGNLTLKDNIDVAPLFKNSGTNDFSLTWTNYPIGDATKSRCIDAGKADSPHDPDGSTADIGALFFNQTLGKFPPRVDFKADTLLGINSLVVTFYDLSDKGTGTITKWQWTFGDGSTSAEQNPAHEYHAEGRFDVTLRIQDENGYETAITKSKYVRIINGVYVKGVVQGTFSAPRYVVGGDLTIESTKSLVINPGVEMMFLGPYKVDVSGALRAIGTSALPIVFTAFDTTGLDLPHATTNYSQKPVGWAGIYINASGPQDSTVIDHCKVQFVRNNGLGAIFAFAANGAAGIQISNSDIGYNATQGITIYSSDIIVRNNYIHHNFARTYLKGGGIYFYAGSPKIWNNIIAHNETASDGGGLCLDWDSRPSLIGNVIMYNKAQRAGGICDYSGYVELINNTISFNTSTGSDGGGYYLLYGGDVTFTNNIITDNAPVQIEVADGYSRVGFRNCILQGGSAAVKGYATSIFRYDNVLTADPKLVTQGYGRLWATSPALDAGTTSGLTSVRPAFDLVGTPRVTNSQIDIGAYEYTTDPPLSVANPIPAITKNEDFDPFIVSLESVFGFQYGSKFLSYSIDNSMVITLFNVTIRDKALYFTSISNKFGDQSVVVTASNGATQISTSFAVHVQPVNDPPSITVDRSPIAIKAGNKQSLLGTVSDVDNDVVVLTPTATNSFFAVTTTSAGTNQYDVGIIGSNATSTIFNLSAADGTSVTKISIPITITGTAPAAVTGIETEAFPHQAYPNPFTDHLVVKAKENSSIVLYDMNGRAVLHDNTLNTDLSLDVEHLAPGLYLLRVDDGTCPHVFKVFKN